jgi:hypothetical protein
LNRQDAKFAEEEEERNKKEKIQNNHKKQRKMTLSFSVFSLFLLLCELGVLAVQFPAFFLGLTITPESIMSVAEIEESASSESRS